MTKRLALGPIGAVVVLASALALLPVFAPAFTSEARDPGPTIAIRGDEVSVDGETIAIDALETRLRTLAPHHVTLAADAHVAASLVGRVTDAAHAAGCDDVSLVVLPP